MSSCCCFPQTLAAFEGTSGCASYVQLDRATHYGMNDFVAPPSTHQATSFLTTLHCPACSWGTLHAACLHNGALAMRCFCCLCLATHPAKCSCGSQLCWRSHHDRAGWVRAQVPPCSLPIPSDDPGFVTDRATQEAGVDLIAGMIDGMLRVREGDRTGDAEDALHGLIRQPRVLDAELHLDCLQAQTSVQ